MELKIAPAGAPVPEIPVQKRYARRLFDDPGRGLRKGDAAPHKTVQHLMWLGRAGLARPIREQFIAAPRDQIHSDCQITLAAAAAGTVQEELNLGAQLVGALRIVTFDTVHQRGQSACQRDTCFQRDVPHQGLGQSGLYQVEISDQS